MRSHGFALLIAISWGYHIASCEDLTTYELKDYGTDKYIIGELKRSNNLYPLYENIGDDFPISSLRQQELRKPRDEKRYNYERYIRAMIADDEIVKRFIRARRMYGEEDYPFQRMYRSAPVSDAVRQYGDQYGAGLQPDQAGS